MKKPRGQAAFLFAFSLSRSARDRAFMTQGDHDSSDASPLQRRLDQAIAEYLAIVEAGQPPDREEFIARYPDLAKHLRSFFAAQDQEKIAPPASTGQEAPTLRQEPETL